MARKRDKNGRFIKGDGGGPGRKSKPVEHSFWRIAKTKCSPEQWAEIVSKAVELAATGDDKARKFVSDIMIGNPHMLRERPDASTPARVDGVDGVIDALACELADVSRFENDPRRAALVGQLSARLLQALEVGELAERLERIEELLNEKSNDGAS